MDQKLQHRKTEKQRIGLYHTMKPFASHLSSLSGNRCVCGGGLFECVRVSTSILAAGPTLLQSFAVSLLNTHNLDSLHSINK